MTEPDPAKQPPLTCANDHDGNTCELCIALTASLNDHHCLSASMNALAIVVSSLSTKLLNLCQDYNALYEQNLCNHNLL